MIDIVRDDLLLEIQTGNFASIKRKMIELVHTHEIRLIYPIALEKWIVKQAKDNGSGATRRKSPKRGRVEDMFKVMVSFPHLIMNPNFSVEVLMIIEEEVRRYEEKRNWRRKGWRTEEHRLLEVADRRLFHTPADFQTLLPYEAKELFTARDLSEDLAIGRPLAQKMAYCLHKAQVIGLTGKQGRAYQYEVSGI
ncbi:MAG: hypothetical protein GY845_20365 [Planctomycetes bacterium]|nr:hypothetical protein [Planctomycetota bacterium]